MDSLTEGGRRVDRAPRAALWKVAQRVRRQETGFLVSLAAASAPSPQTRSSHALLSLPTPPQTE
jgi:hypothetical protein